MVNVIVVGAGFIGTLHIRAWRSIEGAEVVAVVDPSPDRTREAALEQDGIRLFADLGAALAAYPDTGAVSVCTPPGFHKDAVIAAVKHGAAVLLEKPVSANRDDYAVMKQTVLDHSGRVMIGLTQRFYPEVMQARKWIHEGAIGELLSVHDVLINSGAGLPAWYRNRDISGGGVLITNGVHLLDRIQTVTGCEFARICRVQIARDPAGMDTVASTAGTLDGGIPVMLHMEWSETRSEKNLTLYGTKGRIEVSVWDYASLHTGDGSITVRPYRDESGFDDRTLVGLRNELRAFCAGLREGMFPEALTLEGHEPTMRIIWDSYADGAR